MSPDMLQDISLGDNGDLAVRVIFLDVIGQPLEVAGFEGRSGNPFRVEIAHQAVVGIEDPVGVAGIGIFVGEAQDGVSEFVAKGDVWQSRFPGLPQFVVLGGIASAVFAPDQFDVQSGRRFGGLDPDGRFLL